MGALAFAGTSFFDIALALGGDSVTSTAISFSNTGGSKFGIDNLRKNGVIVDWGTVLDNTYTLITGTLDSANLENIG